MKIVFLDGGSLPSPLSQPKESSIWVDRPSTTPDEVVEALQGAEAVITNKVKITRDVLDQCPDLKFVCVAATGYDCIDIAACRDKGVTVSNVPAYSAVSVAESVIASLFALRRHLPMYQAAASNKWANSSHFCVHETPIRDVRGSTLGIIGRGDIGSQVARIARALEADVIFAEHRGATTVRSGYVAFETVLEKADAITLHCPLTPQTRHLIGPNEVALMKPGALLINTARGPLIDENAVLNGLKSGHLGGVALDVLDVEPPQADHPLLNAGLSNLIVTPHVGWASQSSVERLKSVLLANIEAYASGTPKNVVS